MTNPPDLITTSEACEILGGIHRKTLIRWGAEGLITFMQKLPGATTTFLWDRAEIEQLAAERQAS